MAEGLITRASDFAPRETMDRLAAAVVKRGLAILARIDHAGAAAGVDLPLRPTELLIFGNPKGGTPLMQMAQTAGIDLPLKALVWQDADQQTLLSYNDPHWIASRHAAPNPDQIVAAMSAVLRAVVEEATTRSKT